MAQRKTLSYKQLLRLCARAAAPGRTLVVIAATASAWNCAADEVLRGSDPPRLEIVTGDLLLGDAGFKRVSPLLVRAVEAASGAPLAGVRVRFSVVGGAARGVLDDSVGVTDQLGMASTYLTPLATDDTVRVTARSAAWPSQQVVFRAVTGGTRAISLVEPSIARAGDTLRISGVGLNGAVIRVRIGDAFVPALAGVRGGVVRAVVPPCLPAGETPVAVDFDGALSNALSIGIAGTRTALALAPFEFITVPAATVASCLSLEGRGSTYLITAQFASVPSDPAAEFEWRLGADGGTATAVAASRGAGDAVALRRAAPRSLRDAFDASLRKLETQGSLAVARDGASAGAPPVAPAVGSLREFSVVAATDGSRFSRVVARLRYAGDRILAYADTTDNAFASDQLVALVRLMDRDLYPAAVRTFGAVPDVDGDGRVVVLFSPVVNALARREDCFFRGYVKGFFYPPDQLERATGSNRAEIFHAFVPDPAGKYSCPHTEEEVVRALQPEFLHEMQHLISFNERVLVRGGQREETWLGEGLSHVAEELGARVFEARYPPPAGRSTAAQIFPDSAGPYIAPLLLNAYIYLNSTLQHSLTAYVGAGSLEEHGASWLFARWLAAQRGDDVLRRLVQGGRTGIANLEAATGEPFARLFGDFTLALFADSLPGITRTAVPARLRFGDRNVRQMMAREATIAGFAQPFPITTFLLRPGGALRSSMRAGTMVYTILPTDPATAAVGLSFTTPALSPLAPALGAQVSVMRLPP